MICFWMHENKILYTLYFKQHCIFSVWERESLQMSLLVCRSTMSLTHTLSTPPVIIPCGKLFAVCLYFNYAHGIEIAVWEFAIFHYRVARFIMFRGTSEVENYFSRSLCMMCGFATRSRLRDWADGQAPWEHHIKTTIEGLQQHTYVCTPGKQ